MKNRLYLLLSLGILVSPLRLAAANYQLLGWNNLGMHCMDSDYSVFSVLPPYNTIEAQLIVAGKLVTNGVGYNVTYQAVADPTGSFNSTAMGKGNYYQFVTPIYGATLPPEAGLAGWSMPGITNLPQMMLFEPTNHPAAGVATPVNWFRAEGIPIAPYDDAGVKNAYPMMRLIAWSGSSAVATNDIVLPVSDEMDCRACHASGAQAEAEPATGWAWSSVAERDFRLNILLLHDQMQFKKNTDLYVAALAARGFNAQGLYRGVVADGKPVLCASCHASEALGTGSYSNIPPLTASVHTKHAGVLDPQLHVTLDDAANRAACYRCHPGSTTKCLRGAMGGAVALDGSMEIQCQSCHGTMSQVGSIDRVGWFMEPACQSCHTGTATSNNGQIRYPTVFEANGSVRVATNLTFATQADIPATGISLYRFSAGHGGLQCSACHGSTHAEFPSTHLNDNVRNLRVQGHTGVTAECLACHVTMSATTATASAGPHGIHPIGAGWVNFHNDAVQTAADRQKCAACHGTDYRGTVLSRAFGPRTLTANFDTGSVTLNLFQGAIVSCYSCHNGPQDSNPNTSAAPVADNIATNTTSGQMVAFTLPVSGVNAAARILSQPAHGTVGLTNALAAYFPDPGFIGTDTFTFAAWDGAKNSLLATGTVTVAAGPYSLTVQALVPPDYPAQWPAPFNAVAAPSNTTAAVTYDWDFGDGSSHNTNRYAMHAYGSPGTYTWNLVARVDTASASAQGVVVVGPALRLGTIIGPSVQVSWPRSLADAVLEHSPVLGPFANWQSTTNQVRTANGNYVVDLTGAGTADYFRLRQVK